MYLYDEKNLGTVSVYQMEPNQKLISDFRRNKLVHPNGEIYRIATNLKKTPFKFLELECRSVSDFAYSDISYEKTNIFGVSKYHDILKCTEIDDDDKVFLDEYYKGKHNTSPIIRIFNYDQDKKNLDISGHFLIGEAYKSDTILKGNGDKYIDKVLRLTEDIYNLELLNRGLFSRLSDGTDISEQVQLFNFSEEPIYVAHISDLNSLENLGLVVRKDDFSERIVESQKVLKYARNQGLIKK